MSPDDLLGALLRSSLEGAALILLLWVFTRLWPGAPAAARRWLWWLGSLRLLLGLVPVPRIAISPWPSWDDATTAVSAASARVAAMGSAISTPWEHTREAVIRRGDVWLFALLAAWAIGVLVSLVATVRRALALRRQWRAAQPFGDARALRWRAEWAVALGSAHTPEIRVSAAARVPLAVGLRRPGILVPAGSERLSDDALRLVLAHELSHLRRRDPLLGCVPALAETLFWFHPLARFASREYLSAREELCDADALRATGASPREYGELLLDFAVGRHSVLPGCASCGTPAGRRLKRRLEMLSNHASHSPAKRIAAAVFASAFVLIGFAPVRLAAGGQGLDALVVHGSDRLRTKPSPMSYLIKTAGQTGTRGSLDIPADLAAARDLARRDGTVLYLRFGDERWITDDAQIIAEVRGALEDQDAFESRRAAKDRERDALESREESLEARYERLRERMHGLERRQSKLEDQRQELEDAGESTRSVEAEQKRVGRQIDELSGPLNEIAQERTALRRDLRRFEAQDKAQEEESQALERRTMADVERIGRRAIQRGVVERYRPGRSGE
jgi:beta-lactamase regulating signal transducer with metallopeptidase domain